MFSFFSKKKRVVGLEIGTHYVRFVELARSAQANRIISYGEFIPDADDAMRDEDDVLARALMSVKKSVGASDFIVSFPNSRIASAGKLLLRSAGIRPKKSIVGATAVLNAVVPAGSDTSFLVIHAERTATHLFVSSPVHGPAYFTVSADDHEIVSGVNRMYVDWYNQRKEKLHHVLIAGERAREQEFVDYLSRETKLPITRANPLVNLALDHHVVPIIPKGELPKYATALGLAIS